MPKIGGFSLASVPRPGFPFNRRRRGGDLFFHRLGMTLMSGHHIGFVEFDLAAEDLDGLARDDPFAELSGHRLGVVGVEIQLLADLFIREIQAHEIEAEDPDPQRLVMAGEDRPGQVIEELLAGLAPIALPLGLGGIVALPGDPRGIAMGTGDALGPPHLADRLEALSIVDEVLDVDHRR
jgi:hypothetical protein